jgi:hypothetical protein
MFRPLIKLAAAALLVLACAPPASALGMEAHGNAPFHEANYTDWPGIMPVVNHTSRVYHVWVNGNEFEYYRGDTATLNDVLRKFAAAETPVREVVFRPGPASTKTFDQTQSVEFGWSLHLVGGIAKHLTTRDRGGMVWPAHPRLTVYTGGALDLAKVEVPKGVRAVSVTAVAQETREGLKSADQNVRGWACGVLAELDTLDAENGALIAAMLKDKENWVRLNAATSLRLFGKKAAPALPDLRAAMVTDDARLKEEIGKTIEAIEKAPDRAAEERTRREALEQIRKFLANQGQ